MPSAVQKGQILKSSRYINSDYSVSLISNQRKYRNTLLAHEPTKKGIGTYRVKAFRSKVQLTDPIWLLVGSALAVLVELDLDGGPDRVADLSQGNT